MGAALGAETRSIRLRGGIKVKIPSEIKAGGRIRIKGRGYIDRSGNRGDLFIKIRIVNPVVISPEIRKAYEALGKAYRH
jgi:curved DNA-binding protein